MQGHHTFGIPGRDEITASSLYHGGLEVNKANFTFMATLPLFSRQKHTPYTQKMETAQSVGFLGLRALWFGDKNVPKQKGRQHLHYSSVLGEKKKKKKEGAGWGEWFSDNTREETMEGVDSQESLLARS